MGKGNRTLQNVKKMALDGNNNKCNDVDTSKNQ